MKIEHISHPSSQDIDFLIQKISKEISEFGQASPFAFFIRDKNNQIIAGCNGYIIFSAIYTDQLWVHPDHRKFGFGHRLMVQVHDYGCENGCAIATVCTMSFQGAQPFYDRF